MEELLEQWVHYIPLIEIQVQWMLDHDREAREISRWGRWITDLVTVRRRCAVISLCVGKWE